MTARGASPDLGGRTAQMPPHGPVPNGQTVVVAPTGRQTIGRTLDNDVVLAHPQVSSHHAMLLDGPAGLEIRDLGSSNGTYVRGHRLLPGVSESVVPGERVHIGPFRSSSARQGPDRRRPRRRRSIAGPGAPCTKWRPGISPSRCRTETGPGR